jgi:hypothetical protein
MCRRRPFAVTCLFIVLVLLCGSASLSASTICESSLPLNIDAGDLQPLAIALLHQSPTFQQQCLRIAAAVVLRVRVRVTPVISGGRAQTTIQRHETGALRAEVIVLFGGDYVELLAHEFEHILEQLDRVSLTEQVLAKRAWITASGAFETERALAVGARARQECDGLSAAEPIEARHWTLPRPRHPFE